MVTPIQSRNAIINFTRYSNAFYPALMAIGVHLFP